MPPVLPGRRGSRASQHPKPAARPPGRAVQAFKTWPRSPGAAREGRQSWRRGGGPAARHHRRYGPPEHPNERCHGGPPGSRGKAQTSPTQCGGREHAAPRRGRSDLPRRTAIAAAATGEAANIRRPRRSHRSPSSVLAREFSKLGPRRSRASRSAGHLGAG
ncbi:hypothetical protein NDU88_005367 [Pleurodeles waltl]|uniref:Uncharacterized protein n=1 Tax=Pleurodeles waltl TaxID=8319 RepID=A0AAV7QKR0_PLEWA|nr:hypothetical protein NDU88_005367 [Pleurodeles waltl]